MANTPVNDLIQGQYNPNPYKNRVLEADGELKDECGLYNDIFNYGPSNNNCNYDEAEMNHKNYQNNEYISTEEDHDYWKDKVVPVKLESID